MRLDAGCQFDVGAVVEDAAAEDAAIVAVVGGVEDPALAVEATGKLRCLARLPHLHEKLARSRGCDLAATEAEGRPVRTERAGALGRTTGVEVVTLSRAVSRCQSFGQTAHGVTPSTYSMAHVRPTVKGFSRSFFKGMNGRAGDARGIGGSNLYNCPPVDRWAKRADFSE